MIIIIPVVLIIFGSMAATVSATQYSLTITGPQTVAAGQTFVVSGNYQEDNVPKSGVVIGIYEMTPSPSASVGSATTDQNGDYSTTIGPFPVGDHSFVATNKGSPNAPEPYHPTAISNPLITVTVNPANQPPVAHAGPDQSVHVRTLVILDGSQSNDPDGTVQAYQWTITNKPGGSTATFSDPTAVKPQFTADKLGDYTVELVVTDNVGLKSQPASVTVHATNQKPIANAGPGQTGVIRGTTVRLDGSGSSDPDNDPLTYAWTIVAKPQLSTATLTNPTSPLPTFVPDRMGTYKMQLIVNDGYVNSDPSTVTVTVTPTKATVLQDIRTFRTTVQGLPDSAFYPGTKSALLSVLTAAELQLQYNKYGDAAYTLQSKFLVRTDGCALRGTPDTLDLVRTCAAQGQLYPEVNYLKQEIQVLQGS